MALVELQLKKLPEAADNARQAIARNPQARGYQFILGLICELQSDPDAAVAAFRTALAQHPDNAAAAAELQKIEKMRRVVPELRRTQIVRHSQYMPARYLPSLLPLP